MGGVLLRVGWALVWCLAAGFGQAATFEEQLATAIDSSDRSPAERARDANRKPLETLQFFGLREDMRVLELVPGGGWYTKILAPVLEEHGRLYVALGTTGVEELLKKAPYAHVKLVELDNTFDRQGRRLDLAALDFEVRDVDLVLTFRNLHNFTEQGREVMNRASFQALKAGGHYGVVDHTLRHNAQDTAETWRRMDPVRMIKEIQAVGFELVDFSGLHYRPDDELRYEVGRKSVTGNTDRFTLLFRKPN